MATKNIEKRKEIEMEKKVFPFLVVNNSNLKPYIEVFDYKPENIIQKPLGILTGFFEIRDYSEDSAYIVNFLNSVVKKEYYSNPRRSVQDSFDSSLHKANVALSEVAKHGNINWLGKIDSAICVFEKNALHFSSTGNARILLWRNGILNDITENISEAESEMHPLKTFTNVSSGRMENHDRVIITSADIFNVLSIQDIQKGLSRFENDKFRQFLKTAIGNELDVAGTVVVENEENEQPVIKKTSLDEVGQAEILNAFSGTSFTKKKGLIESALQETNEKESEKTDYTDDKTGHIYIQGEDQGHTNESYWKEKFLILKEDLDNSFHGIYSAVTKKTYSAYKRLLTLIISYKRKLVQKRTSGDKGFEKIVNKSIKPLPGTYTVEIAENLPSCDEGENYKATLSDKLHSLSFKLRLWIKKTKIRMGSLHKARPSDQEYGKKRLYFLPNLQKIRSLFSRLSLKQKAVSIIIVFAVLFLPLILGTINKNKPEITPSPSTEISPEPTAKEIYSQEKNMVFIEQVEKMARVEGGVGIFTNEDGLFYITKDSVMHHEKEPGRYTWTESQGKCVAATYMKDLGLIFIITDSNKIMEFSTKTKTFKENSIFIPEKLLLGPVSTYLTYLYIVDKEGGEIYRYPRAEGGFGEKKDWLDKNSDLSWTESMSIDENLYLSGNGQLKKYFQGKEVDLSLEDSRTQIQFDLIYTTPESSEIMTLDRKNSRISKLTKDGKIVRQYHHEAIGKALGFSVDFDKNKAYILTKEELDSFPIQ